MDMLVTREQGFVTSEHVYSILRYTNISLDLKTVFKHRNLFCFLLATLLKNNYLKGTYKICRLTNWTMRLTL